ncbi:prophage tail fiber N-terminal domain-containing protein [Serratia grimesii]|uniref:phage tail fiber protein n=1 Tax=Serratia grimesii TaxID=82995 RepID=UPI003839FDED
MTLISGVLKGPYGDPRSGVTITMRAVKTSSTVLSLAKSQSVTDASGKYSLSVEPGAYDVIISVYGAQPDRVGTIEVYNDSLPGTLNDFLGRPGEIDITPEIVQTVDRLRIEAAASASKASSSAVAAKVSEQNAAKSAVQVAIAFDNARFKFPENNTNVAVWFLLGRFKNAGQNGVGIAIDFYGSSGFNGFTYNSGLSRLMLRTGNLSASDTTNKVNRIGGIFINDTGTTISDIQIIESSRDNYDIYVKVNAFTINCWYTVEQITYANAAGLRWEHRAEKQSTDPVGVMKIDIRTGVSFSQGLALPDYATVAQSALAGFGTGPIHVVDAFSKDNKSSIQRYTAATANRPGNVSGGLLTLPVDGGPSCSYFAISALRQAWVGTSNNVLPSAITWSRLFSTADQPTVADISNLKDWGLSKGVTAAVKGNFNAQMQSRRSYVATDPIGNPFKDTGTYFLDTRSWAVTQAGTDDSYRTVQTCYGYGVNSSQVGKIAVRSWSGSTFSPWVWMWSEANTTVDSNGFIKKASPIARLSCAVEKMQADYLDGGFTPVGCVAVNGEASGVGAERVSTGVYQITGSLGLAVEGWTIEVPQDINGNRLCFVETSTGKDGTIYVKVSKRRFDVDTAAIVAGEPMDIPDGRWIDLRLKMPARAVSDDMLLDG